MHNLNYISFQVVFSSKIYSYFQFSVYQKKDHISYKCKVQNFVKILTKCCSFFSCQGRAQNLIFCLQGLGNSWKLLFAYSFRECGKVCDWQPLLEKALLGYACFWLWHSLQKRCFKTMENVWVHCRCPGLVWWPQTNIYGTVLTNMPSRMW